MTKILFILLLTSNLLFGQSKKKLYKLPNCDTTRLGWLNEFSIDQFTISDKNVSDWLSLNYNGPPIKTSADFLIVFNDKKNVCCRRLIIYDSTKADINDFSQLIDKFLSYPDFVDLGKKYDKPIAIEGIIHKGTGQSIGVTFLPLMNVGK